jgi:hypothetical protein
METELPKIADPQILNPEPNFELVRTDTELPIMQKSKRDILLPYRAHERIETLEDTIALPTTDILAVDPAKKAPNTDKPEPSLPN